MMQGGHIMLDGNGTDRLVVRPGYCSTRNANLLTLENGGEIWWESSHESDLSAGRLNDDFAALAALPLAMADGRDLFVDGAVDRRLIIALEDYSHAWALWRPKDFHPVRIDARKIASFGPEGAVSGSLVALSGGIDSVFALKQLCTAPDHRLYERPVATVTMHGFDIPWRDTAAFAPTAQCAGEISARFGLPNLTVRTNWTDHVGDYLTFHPLGIACVFHQHNARFTDSFIAADFDFAEDARIHPKGSNAVTNRMLSSSALSVGVLGEREVRVRKTLDILEDEVLDANLTPCTGKDSNRGEPCGRCRKCVFTDIARFYRDRESMTFAEERGMFLRIVRHYKIRGAFTYVFATEAAGLLRRECRLLWLGIKVRLGLYHIRNLRRALLTGARIKAIRKFAGLRK
jgi:hypothetical protein